MRHLPLDLTFPFPRSHLPSRRSVPADSLRAALRPRLTFSGGAVVCERVTGAERKALARASLADLAVGGR
jgi:hypothetical protein